MPLLILLNQNFNPIAPNQIWAGDVTYLKTGEGWMYLAIVMDLYSWRIVGWHIDKCMTTDLVSKAMMKACNLRQPPKGLVFHLDRASQYTSKQYRKLLANYGVRASVGDVGACWDIEDILDHTDGEDLTRAGIDQVSLCWPVDLHLSVISF